MAGLQWIRLDTTFPDNPKIMDLVDRRQHSVVVAHVSMMCHVGKTGTDGYFAEGALRRYGITKKEAYVAAESGLWIPSQGGSRAIVDLINAGFTEPGQHLADAQTITGHNANYIGGNIMAADGNKVSSQDTWAVVEGNVVFAITSDARERTAFVDGRHMPALEDWPDANNTVSACVGAVERARNTQGG